MNPHPAYAEFHERFKGALTTAAAFRGTLYRACDPTYANTRDLLTGHGSRAVGGRWNAPGGFAMVYLARTIEGSIAEALGLPGVFGFDPDSRLPITLVAVEAQLDFVLDLTHVRVRRALAVTLKSMNECNWRSDNAAGKESLTQALGRAAFELGAQGIIVPSATKQTFRNLNIFPAHLGKTARLSILRAERLPAPPPPGIL
jgi:RES domain-containing protein